MSEFDRQKDILQIIENLDITPTMYKNAVEKYAAVASYLESHNIKADIYPQGSFALGTVVRPTRGNSDGYDLDFICQLQATRTQIAPEAVWNMVKDAMVSSDLYKEKLTLNQNGIKCITIEYAAVGEFGFSMDIVPAVDESLARKIELKAKSTVPQLLETAIALPYQDYAGFTWATNNPKGYRAWFEGINSPFVDACRDSYRKQLFLEHTYVYNSVEEIPDELIRSSLQRVIQILKYHRNVYYGKISDGEEIKPNSAIITTIVANIAKSAPQNISTFELLKMVLLDLDIYAKHQTMSNTDFIKMYGEKKNISRNSGRWFIENPANPEDNLADHWNTDARIPREFFKWASTVREDLLDSLKCDDTFFRTKIEAAFGRKQVSQVWGNRYCATSPKPISNVTIAKPWSCQ